MVGENSIGFAGELAPALAAERDLPRRVAALEIDLDVLYSTAPEVRQASPIFGYPAATQDLSLLVAVDVAAAAAFHVGTILDGAPGFTSPPLVAEAKELLIENAIIELL